jgi:hypothetical protein
MPKPGRTGRNHGHNHSKNETYGKDNQREQSDCTNPTVGFCGELRVNRKGWKNRAAGSGGYGIVVEPAIRTHELPEKRSEVDAAGGREYGQRSK